MTWKLYYADCTTFTPEDGAWIDAPAWGVVGLVVPDDRVKRTIGANDFYGWPAHLEDPTSFDLFGVLDMLAQFDPLFDPTARFSDLSPQHLIDRGIKFGRMLDNRTWQDTYQWILDDADRMYP